MSRVSGRQGFDLSFSNQSASRGSDVSDRVDPVVATWDRRALEARDQ